MDAGFNKLKFEGYFSVTGNSIQLSTSDNADRLGQIIARFLREKIESRYYRSLGLMYDAAELSYQAFFFDNSKENSPFELVAHFKKRGDKKVWDKISKKK